MKKQPLFTKKAFPLLFFLILTLLLPLQKTYAESSFDPENPWETSYYELDYDGEEVLYLWDEVEGADPEGFNPPPPAYFCGKRDAVLILVALGALTDYAIGKIPTKSPLSVKGNDAIEGKFKVYEKIDTSTAQKKVRFAMEKGTIDTRTRLFDALNGLDTNSIKLLTNDGDMMGCFLLFKNFKFYNKTKLSNIKTSATVNNELNLLFPPYKVNTNVPERITTQPIEGEFIRFHQDATLDPSIKINSPWMVRRSVIEEQFGIEASKWNSDEIQDFLALPQAPTHFSKMNIPLQTKLREGVIGPQPQWNNAQGGGIQHEVVDSTVTENWFDGDQSPLTS